jgi:hypothetical protein
LNESSALFSPDVLGTGDPGIAQRSSRRSIW